MRDREGKPTTSLSSAKGWVKDNRLLPFGYDVEHSEASYTNPVGVGDDPDFVAGGDTTRYELTLPEGATLEGATLSVRLVYQSLSARFVRGLFQNDTPEVAAFKTMYDRADVRPVEMTEVSVTLP